MLVVDDDADSRALVGSFLKNLGYRAKLAADGNEALEAFAHGGVSAILMDLAIPSCQLSSQPLQIPTSRYMKIAFLKIMLTYVVFSHA